MPSDIRDLMLSLYAAMGVTEDIDRRCAERMPVIPDDTPLHTAVLVRKLEGYRGDARLYKLSFPIDDDGLSYDYVMVSAADVPYSGEETMIFPANGNEKVLSWGELPGSFRGALDHERALRNAGYVLA